MKKFYLSITKFKEKRLLTWPYFIVYYMGLRVIFDINYYILYGFSIMIILLGFNFGVCALIFFCLSLISFIFSSPVEANHYMSFVYGFLVLSALENIYLLIKKRETLNK